MKLNIFCICAALSAPCLSAEFDNSIGFGVQYGGLIGWQGSVTEQNLHGRIAIGLIGITLGADVDVSDKVSLGATVGGIAIASVTSFNVNYYSSGKYTEGWRFGLDIGTAETDTLGHDSGSFTALSIGYSFR